MPETITDKELLQRIIWNEADGFQIVDESTVDRTRWHVVTETIFQQSDGRFFLMYWRKAATESQEHEYPDVAFECEPYRETITKYRRVV